MKKYQIYGIFVILFLFLFHAIYGIAFFYKNYHIKDTSIETKFVGHISEIVWEYSPSFELFSHPSQSDSYSDYPRFVSTGTAINLKEQNLYKNCVISTRDYFFDIRETDYEQRFSKIVSKDNDLANNVSELFSYSYSERKTGEIENMKPNYTATCNGKKIDTKIDAQLTSFPGTRSTYDLFINKTDLEKFKTEYYKNKEKIGFIEKTKSALSNYYEYWSSIIWLLYANISELGNKN